MLKLVDCIICSMELFVININQENISASDLAAIVQ